MENSATYRIEQNFGDFKMPVVIFDECQSTNSEAADLLRKNVLPAPFVVVAKRQTKGRGRLGRNWFSREGASICMSVCADFGGLAADIIESATVRAGIAVCAALSELCGNKLLLKWPNDIYSPRGEKISGMLAELVQVEKSYKIVFGIGINYDLSDCCAEAQTGLTVPASDLRTQFNPLKNGHFSTITTAAATVANSAFKELCSRNLSSIADFEKYDFLRNKSVNISIGNSQFSGVACGVNPKGNLLVRLGDGTIKTVNSGEATLHNIG